MIVAAHCTACRASLLTGTTNYGMVINDSRMNPNQRCLGICRPMPATTPPMSVSGICMPMNRAAVTSHATASFRAARTDCASTGNGRPSTSIMRTITRRPVVTNRRQTGPDRSAVLPEAVLWSSARSVGARQRSEALLAPVRECALSASNELSRYQRCTLSRQLGEPEPGRKSSPRGLAPGPSRAGGAPRCRIWLADGCDRRPGPVGRCHRRVTSDHGELFGFHGRRAKRIFYEEASHVPLPPLVQLRARGQQVGRMQGRMLT